MKYNILAGFDYDEFCPVFHVVGTDNDYVGEWHFVRLDAERELERLIKRSIFCRRGHSFSITGYFLDCTRFEIIERISKGGGVYHNSPKRDTDWLICGYAPGSAKLFFRESNIIYESDLELFLSSIPEFHDYVLSGDVE